MDAAGELGVGICVEGYGDGHILAYFGIFVLAYVDDDFDRLNLFDRQNRQLACHVARIVVACGDYSRDWRGQNSVLYHVGVLTGLGVDFCLKLVDRLLRAGSDSEKFLGAVEFDAGIVESHFKLGDIDVVENYKALAFCYP